MGTVCREAVNDCDIRETCSGNSSQVIYRIVTLNLTGKSRGSYVALAPWGKTWRDTMSCLFHISSHSLFILRDFSFSNQSLSKSAASFCLSVQVTSDCLCALTVLFLFWVESGRHCFLSYFLSGWWKPEPVKAERPTEPWVLSWSLFLGFDTFILRILHDLTH